MALDTSDVTRRLAAALDTSVVTRSLAVALDTNHSTKPQNTTTIPFAVSANNRKQFFRQSITSVDGRQQ